MINSLHCSGVVPQGAAVEAAARLDEAMAEGKAGSGAIKVGALPALPCFACFALPCEKRACLPGGVWVCCAERAGRLGQNREEETLVHRLYLRLCTAYLPLSAHVLLPRRHAVGALPAAWETPGAWEKTEHQNLPLPTPRPYLAQAALAKAEAAIAGTSAGAGAACAFQLGHELLAPRIQVGGYGGRVSRAYRAYPRPGHPPGIVCVSPASLLDALSLVEGSMRPRRALCSSC